MCIDFAVFLSDGLINIAKNKVNVGGFRVLSEYMLNGGAFEKYVKETVHAQLNLE